MKTQTKAQKQGRPPKIKSEAEKLLPLFRTLNNREIAEMMIRDRSIRAKMKGGMKGDRDSQFKAAYVCVAKLRNEKLAENKRVQFVGREGIGGKKLIKWSRLPTPKQKKAEQSAAAK